MLDRLIRTTLLIGGIGIVLAMAYPLMQRQVERTTNAGRLDGLEARLAGNGWDRLAVVGPCATEWDRMLRVEQLEPLLATWETIGGCGVGGGGASSAGGGVKWVGRNVTGGLLDLQCIGSTTVLDNGTATVINLRPGMAMGDKWNFAFNVPMVHKTQDDLDVFGEEKSASITGYGDISLELTRKLGITNSSNLTLVVAFPNAAHNAVRQGVVLPQQSQLGAGKLSGSMTFEHTFDKMWGLIIAGGNLGYGGGENSIGDYRSPSGSAYVYTGYLLGPFVPSVGLTLAGKTRHDRERHEILDEQPLYTANANLALEWSSDYLAILLGGVGSFSKDGLESWTVALGASASVF